MVAMPEVELRAPFKRNRPTIDVTVPAIRSA
jgi:hypothetical protein